MYEGSEVDFLVDPKSTQTYRQKDSQGNYIDLPFTEARIDGFTVDFTSYVGLQTVLTGYLVN